MAIMASGAPIEPMSFTEKAQPLPATNAISIEAEVNGSPNHYDTLFDEPAKQNGTMHAMQEPHPPTHQEDTGASKLLTAEDTSAAPIEHVASGISPVAAFISDPAPTALEPPATSTVPPPIEQPVSDIREDPLPAASAAMEEQEPAPTEPASTVIAEDPAPIDEAQSATEDKMDTTEDIVAPAEPKANAQMHTEELVPSIEPAASSVTSTLPAEMAETPAVPAESVTVGQVRPREEEDDVDDAEPSAKRAKTESADIAAQTLPTEIPLEPTETAPAALQESIASTSTESATAATLAKPAVSIDSDPMTPGQQKFLLEQVRKAKKTKSAVYFLKPVDPIALNIPNYKDVIKQPMDLHTLEENLKEKKYNSVDDFVASFELIVQNAITFNGPSHTVAQAGQILKAYFVKCVSMIPKGEAAASLEVRPKKAEPPPPPKPRPERRATAKSPTDKSAGFLNEHGMPIIRRDSSAQNDRPKREIHPPKRDLPASTARPKKKKAQLELKFCETVIKEILKPKYASINYPFVQPVDPVALNIPNYHKVVKKPMDFGTIQSNMKAGLYSNAKEFYNDSKLVFANCFKFNPPTDDVYKMGKSLEELFEKTWENKDQWLADNAPTSEPVSEDEEEEEEEEEPEEHPNMRRLQDIQAQIAALSAEALQLSTAPKRASPKAASKSKGAKSAGGKAKRTNSMATASAAPKAAKPKSKPQKIRKLTLEQKREVSEGIANLDEAKMRRAVQIIRNGVPALANVQDDELELDIDEIPDDVVYKLYEFVKSSLPKKERQPSPDYEDDDEDEYAQKPSTGNRKKNKPMKANEQEERIKQLQARLHGYNGSGSDQSPHGHAEDSDEDASESSEEE